MADRPEAAGGVVWGSPSAAAGQFAPPWAVERTPLRTRILGLPAGSPRTPMGQVRPAGGELSTGRRHRRPSARRRWAGVGSQGNIYNSPSLYFSSPLLSSLQAIMDYHGGGPSKLTPSQAVEASPGPLGGCFAMSLEAGPTRGKRPSPGGKGPRGGPSLLAVPALEPKRSSPAPWWGRRGSREKARALFLFPASTRFQWRGARSWGMNGEFFRAAVAREP